MPPFSTRIVSPFFCSYPRFVFVVVFVVPGFVFVTVFDVIASSPLSSVLLLFCKLFRAILKSLGWCSLFIPWWLKMEEESDRKKWENMDIEKERERERALWVWVNSSKMKNRDIERERKRILDFYFYINIFFNIVLILFIIFQRGCLVGTFYWCGIQLNMPAH